MMVGKRKQGRTKAGASILRAMREVMEHIEGKRELRTTIVYVDKPSRRHANPTKTKKGFPQRRKAAKKELHAPGRVPAGEPAPAPKALKSNNALRSRTDK
jgi:hypothetical protein